MPTNTVEELSLLRFHAFPSLLRGVALHADAMHRGQARSHTETGELAQRAATYTT